MSSLIEDDVVTPVADQRVLVHEPRSEAFESIFENAGRQAVGEDGCLVVDETPEFETAVERETQAEIELPGRDRGHKSRRHGRDECGRAGVRGIADPFDQKFPRCRTHALTNGLKSKAFRLRGHTV